MSNFKESNSLSRAMYAIAMFFVGVSCSENEDLPFENGINSKEGQAKMLANTPPNLPTVPFSYNVILPAYLTTPQINRQNNTPDNNPTTDNGATLGRVLFYDKALSLNQTVACANCHQQNHAFSDPARFSRGFNGGLTTRNSMSLLNARFYPNGRFFWDERSATAEIQASRPIVHPVEMGMTMTSLISRLNTLNYYPSLYQKAFGTNTIDSAQTVKAIAQFIRSMVSYRSKYDVGRGASALNANIRQVNFPNFTPQENQGKAIFFGVGNCGACHGTDTFAAPSAKNNGLDVNATDNGVGGITGIQNQNGLFKVPSLKGAEKSAPYMHDGRFRTLEDVVEHYNSQVRPHPNLSPEMRNPNGQPRRLNLSTADKAALVAFLKTLSDTGIETDPKFSNPF
jgi:cytochrome c peroxidase